MTIVTRNSDSAVVMVADMAGSFDPSLYTIRNLPGWDWSLANLTGVDKSKIDWITQLMWDGTTLVKKP